MLDREGSVVLGDGYRWLEPWERERWHRELDETLADLGAARPLTVERLGGELVRLS